MLLVTWQLISEVTHSLLLCAGKKRVWIPDEKEAYTEVEIKDTDGDKVMVETKDGMVSVASIALFLFCDNAYK